MVDISLAAVGATTCAFATVFGWIAIKRQREHRDWCAKGIRASGVVSRLGERRGAGLSEDAAGMSTDATFHTVPVVLFRAANGIEYEIDAPDAPPTIGSVVEVAYEPAQPSGARAIHRTPKVGCAVILFVIGLTLIVIAISR